MARAAVEQVDAFVVQTRRDTSVKGEGTASFDKAEPLVQTAKWNAQAPLSIRYAGESGALRQIDASTFAWDGLDGLDCSLHAYDVGVTDELDEGGLEMEVILSSLPSVNAWAFEIPQWQDYDLDWQAPLANLNKDGSTYETNPWGGQRIRPAHISGSLAIYAPDRHGYQLGGVNYEIGKVGHIHRPKAIDASGAWVWGELTYKAGTVTVTVPWSFLEGATYPVRVDPTFGYSGTAASDDNLSSTRILCSATSTPASNGTLTSITIKGRIKSSTNGTPTHGPAIFSDSSGPGSNLASAETGTVYGAGDAEVTTNLSYASLVAGTQYWLGSKITLGEVNDDAFFKYDASGGTGNMRYRTYGGGTSTAWEATAAGYSSADNEKVYIYATYTASAAAANKLLAQQPGRPGIFKPAGDLPKAFGGWR